ncbi:MAG: AAA family ATPase [Patescibacteria group bacterium]|nr:AAA family ATPase [Patescibacteria group bacterium]
MYLKQLEIAGFKSFAQKIVMQFPPPTTGADGRAGGLTAIVGPNGSGKSNIADAMRWSLGEQSLKTLRGKKAEDVIFSGSATKARLGLAEVSLTLNNDDRAMPVDYPEVVITRRLYRNGEGEYLLNKQPVRLTDAVLLMAKANFGQKSYSVIGQGMVDAILNATPQERKEFFEEAAGVKQYQLKRENSVRKLLHTWENIKQAEAVIEEIEPRLRSLNRQVHKLQRREEIEKELVAKQREYYGAAWQTIAVEEKQVKPQLVQLQTTVTERTRQLAAVQEQLNKLEQEDRRTEVFNRLQQRYQKAIEARSALKESQLVLRNKIEMAQARAKMAASPVPLPEIVERLGAITKTYDAFIAELAAAQRPEQLAVLRERAQTVAQSLRELIALLQHGKKNVQAGAVDPQLQTELHRLSGKLEALDAEVTESQSAITEFNAAEEQKRGKFFDLQRQFQSSQSELNATSAKLSELRVEMAKLDTRREAIEQEVAAELKATDWLADFKPAGSEDANTLHAEIINCKRQLEFIGGIEPETVAEFTQTKERYDFLTTQVTDLRKSLDQLRAVIVELDSTIHRQFNDAFRAINHGFARYFKVLFNGGKAELFAITQDAAEAEEEKKVEAAAEGVEVAEEADTEEEDIKKLLKGHVGKLVVGVEIRATPPGKKLTSVQMLSGGERALTSIALISAIIANNPSPFVVLDEVDAALDEANSERFGAILAELSGKTQFVVITHNRATMHRAAVLYGVTMGEDGVSRILSLKLEEGEKLVNR